MGVVNTQPLNRRAPTVYTLTTPYFSKTTACIIITRSTRHAQKNARGGFQRLMQCGKMCLEMSASFGDLWSCMFSGVSAIWDMFSTGGSLPAAPCMAICLHAHTHTRTHTRIVILNLPLHCTGKVVQYTSRSPPPPHPSFRFQGNLRGKIQWCR